MRFPEHDDDLAMEPYLNEDLNWVLLGAGSEHPHVDTASRCHCRLVVAARSKKAYRLSSVKKLLVPESEMWNADRCLTHSSDHRCRVGPS